MKGIGFLKAVASPVMHRRNPLDKQRLLRITLQAILIGSLAYLVFIYSYPLRTSEASGVLQSNKEEVALPRTEAKAEEQFYQACLQAVGRRQIFAQSQAQEARETHAAARLDSAGELRLLGVVLGERPQAVIENTQTQTTYYVTKGQSIGSALVENIEADRVTLIDNGKRFEIQL